MRTYVVYPIVLCLICGFIGCGQDKADKSQEGTSQNEVALDASKIFVTLIEVELTDPSDSVRLVRPPLRQTLLNCRQIWQA